MFKLLSKVKSYFFSPIYTKLTIQNDTLLDARFDEVKQNIIHQMPDNLVKYGSKCYSAGEEDGIIQAIFEKIKPDNKIFLEIGAGYGLENNTHFMLLNNWRGTWIDGSKTNIEKIKNNLGGLEFPELLVRNYFVDSNNVNKILSETLNYFKVSELDFFSLDIDGNDYAVMESIFENSFFPKAICVEYNGKYPYPCNVKVRQNEGFVWGNDDYMGVSLAAWIELMEKYNYTLLCCDCTGNNAFFIQNKYANLFTIYHPSKLFQPARYYLVKRRVGHIATLKFLKHKLNPNA